MHGEGIAHLDLKPANIMFKESDMKTIAIIDFGSAKFIGDNLSSDFPALTYNYCAPELDFSTSANITDKTDIFSFGMYLFICFLNF